jgi:hypothetical protein
MPSILFPHSTPETYRTQSILQEPLLVNPLGNGTSLAFDASHIDTGIDAVPDEADLFQVHCYFASGSGSINSLITPTSS